MTGMLRLRPVTRALGLTLVAIASLALISLVGGSAAKAAPASGTSTTAVTGLVAAYAFESTSGAAVVDSSGLGNDGVGSGGVWTPSGKFGRALVFNGTNAITKVTDRASLDLSSGMTLEAWVNPKTAGSNWRSVVLKGRSTGIAYGLYAGSNNGAPAGIAYTTSERTAKGTSGLPVSTWSHLAATYDGTTVRLYVNGAQVATRTGSGSLANGSGPLQIGGNESGSQWFNGTIDELRIYNRALSPSEIATDMATPIGSTTGDTTPPSAPTALVKTGSTTTSVALSSNASSDNMGVSGYGLYRDGVAAGSASSPAYAFSGLACNTSYSLAVDAYDAAGNRSAKTTMNASSSACAPGGDTQVPSTPTGFVSSTPTQTSLSVAWNASTDNVGVSGYGLYRNGTLAGSTGSRTYTYSGLTCATSYTLAADAYDAAGNRSGKATITASTSSCTTPPPDGLTPTPRATTVVNAPSGTTVKSDTFYQNPLGSLSWPRGIDRVTVTGATRMPGFFDASVDIWVQGTPTVPMVIDMAGTADEDAIQIKGLSTDMTFRYFLVKNTHRTGSKHTDALQLMQGRRITFVDGAWDNNSVQTVFVRNSGSSAGGGVIEDITFLRMRVTRSLHSNSFNISGDDEEQSGTAVPTRVIIKDSCSDKSVVMDSSVRDRGGQVVNHKIPC